MRKRTLARECTLKILYQADVTRDALDEILPAFWAMHPAPDDVREFAERLVKGCRDHLSDIDQKIGQYTENWALKRMAVVDRNILRFSVYELLYMDEIPPKVTINEAVNIASLIQAEMRPIFAAVQAFVNAVAAGLAVARVAFSGAHPDHVRVALGDGHRTDRCHRLIVKNRLPVDATAGGFPQPARSRAHVNDVRVADHHIDSRHPAAHAGRSDGAGFHALELLHIEFLGVGG